MRRSCDECSMDKSISCGGDRHFLAKYLGNFDDPPSHQAHAIGAHVRTPFAPRYCEPLLVSPHHWVHWPNDPFYYGRRWRSYPSVPHHMF